ncbi:hypothetical protein LTR75_009393 [Friedmanniomyces endolithicus]|nr:hypothetical protein LTR75_009393 [Friedmanniomyces endolithicus]
MASDSEHEDDSKTSDQSIPLRPAPSSAQNQGTTITGNVVLPRYFQTDSTLLNATNVVRDYRNGVDTNRPHDPRTQAEIATLQMHMRDSDAGQFVNVGQIPAGLGRWEWLDYAVDGQHARDLGFDTPAQVELARNQNIFTQGAGARAGPSTVWRADMRYYNPRRQPAGQGRWEFHTTYDRDLANLNFGGNDEHGFGDVPNPTAAQVRQRRGADSGLNLVWIPAGAAPTQQSTLAHADTEPEDEGHVHGEPDPNDTESENMGHARGQHDPAPNLPHDPLNRGENDQTGDNSAAYHTREIDGKNFTIDRSRAHHGTPKPHKSWIVTKKGVWQQWTGASTLNWGNHDAVEKLNNYTTEQTAWLNGFKEAEINGKLQQSIEEITTEFNRRFTQNRESSGVYAVIDRLRKKGFNPQRRKRNEAYTDEQKQARQAKRAKNGKDKSSQGDDGKDDGADGSGDGDGDDEEDGHGHGDETEK